MAGELRREGSHSKRRAGHHGEVDTAGFGGGAAGVGRHGVGERTDRRGPCISEGREKAPRTEGTTNRSVTPTFYKNKNFVQIGVHIKMHIKL
jgi:hypothetical protein